VLRRVDADTVPYTDTAMTPVDGSDVDRLELFRSTAGGHRVAEKQRRRRAAVVNG
jgi:hypothetical protein